MLFSVLTVPAALFVSATVQAHVSVTSKTAFAGSYYEATLAVPHGCDGDDTYKVVMTIPGTFGKVRAIHSSFGPSSIETIMDGETITSYTVTWERSGNVSEADTESYNFGFRTKLPDTPFTSIHFPTVQYCRDDETLEESTSEWVGTAGHDHDSTSDELPAPSLFIYPKRYPGWNQYTVDEHIHDLSVFDDAEIVWFGTSAYSSNPVTMEMIRADGNAGVLEQIHPGSEIWVKY
ncbi:hypothetical protein BTA51_15040 [Hahella sp. CCB-MM4]|nr:hypothetical protein BTA51_15040 [Hahella sp. CCB-MM4]